MLATFPIQPNAPEKFTLLTPNPCAQAHQQKSPPLLDEWQAQNRGPRLNQLLIVCPTSSHAQITSDKLTFDSHHRSPYMLDEMSIEGDSQKARRGQKIIAVFSIS